MTGKYEEWVVPAVVTSLSVLVWIYDIISLPFYSLAQWPWSRLSKAKKVHAGMVPGTQCIYRNTDPARGPLLTLERLKLDTVPKVVQYAINKHAGKACFGVREILSEEDEPQPNGKMFKKFTLGQYRWVSHLEFGQRVEWFGRALLELGLKPKQKICIFGETRGEWLCSAIGALSQNITVVTLYATLGEDAIVHGINETEVTHLVTSHDLIPKVKPVLERCPHVTHVIYMEDQLKETDVTGFREGLHVLRFKDVLRLGEPSTREPEPPTPEDIAIIMYTSGSTGTPKGVLLSHHNMVSTMAGFAVGAQINSDDVYLGYLPLAHVLELTCELCCVMFGVPIGYSSALTLLDTSSKVKRGCQGDAAALKPTLMAAVPLILDRVIQGLQAKMSSAGPMAQAMFQWAVTYRNAWRRRGFDTPILHRLVFSRVAALLGGNIRMMACGGAPLSEVTHDTIRSCIGTRLLQGYGLTETTSCATLMDADDVSVGRVGHMVHCCTVRLENWQEGSYSITDRPRPRGEIVIGGDNVAMGYFKLPDKTEESFFEENGKRWFRTGDIGEMYPNGTLKIIDRKKDLVKLQSGEYISLGRVETVLKTSSLVENMFVYAEPSRAHVIAVVLPVPAALQTLAAQVLGAGDATDNVDDLCKMDSMEQAVQRKLAEQAKQGRLDKWEVPRHVALTSVIWTPDNNLVTAAFKLKRKELSNFYRAEIDRLYSLD